MDCNVPTLLSEADEEPSTTERAISEIWHEVLQVAEPPRPTDDFFSLGGDSMRMVMLEFRIKEEFSVELPVGSVLGAPTVRELSALVDAARATADGHANDIASI